MHACKPYPSYGVQGFRMDIITFSCCNQLVTNRNYINKAVVSTTSCRIMELLVKCKHSTVSEIRNIRVSHEWKVSSVLVCAYKKESGPTFVS